MMVSSSSYIEQFENAEYLNLIEERDNLLAFIKDYEAKDIAGDRSGEEWLIHPQPDVRYQMYLEYLGELCNLMREKYNSDYVWGDRKLKDDAEKGNKKTPEEARSNDDIIR